MHKTELADLTNAIKQKADISLEKLVPNVESYVTNVEGRLTALEGNVSQAFVNVRKEFGLIKSMLNFHSSGGGLMPTSGSSIANLESKITSLEKSVTSLLKGDVQDSTCVRVGKFEFHSIEDVGVWIDKYLPPSTPFGPFVDVYSFLERVKSYKDIDESVNAVYDMDLRKKANLTSDEATVIDAFVHPLPRVFRGSGGYSSAGQLGSWLPGVKNKEAWENKSNTLGIRVAIEDSTSGIRSRLDNIISLRLSKDYATGKSYEEAADLAKIMLADTCNFISKFNAFVSNTHLNLTEAGYPDKSAWHLVTKLGYRFFATDCFHGKRGIASEMMDSNDHRSMAKTVLWATFSTHEVMRSYVRMKFEDHPSISAEYTRYLIANAGVAKIERALESVNTLNTLIASIEKKVDTADKKATTASSKADEALRAAKRAKRED